MPPFNFTDYSALMKNSYCVVSDSGTLPEEAAVSGFPCVSIRTSTERPEAFDKGQVVLGGITEESIIQAIDMVVKMADANEHIQKVPDYEVDNVSSVVIRMIQSYTRVIDDKIWRKMAIYKEQLQQVINQKLPWEKLMGKTVLISGATGMIGKCLIDILMLRNKKYHDKIQIVALSRNNNSAKERLQQYWSDPLLNYQCCDVNEKICEIGDVDYIVHAASNTHPVQYATDPVGTILTNVMGTKNLLDYAVTHHVKRFVFYHRLKCMEKIAEMWRSLMNPI